MIKVRERDIVPLFNQKRVLGLNIFAAPNRHPGKVGYEEEDKGY
jgi:hypothetical protein